MSVVRAFAREHSDKVLDAQSIGWVVGALHCETSLGPCLFHPDGLDEDAIHQGYLSLGRLIRDHGEYIASVAVKDESIFDSDPSLVVRDVVLFARAAADWLVEGARARDRARETLVDDRNPHLLADETLRRRRRSLASPPPLGSGPARDEGA